MGAFILCYGYYRKMDGYLFVSDYDNQMSTMGLFDTDKEAIEMMNIDFDKELASFEILGIHPEITNKELYTRSIKGVGMWQVHQLKWD